MPAKKSSAAEPTPQAEAAEPDQPETAEPDQAQAAEPDQAGTAPVDQPLNRAERRGKKKQHASISPYGAVPGAKPGGAPPVRQYSHRRGGR